MRALLDTSTLVAGVLTDHVHYVEANAWLKRARAGAFEFFVSGHSLAEAYANLTRMPRKPPLRPDEVLRMLDDDVLQFAQIVTLTGNDYIALVTDLARRAQIGGIVYDGVIAKAAELAQVDRLVTLNVLHFQRVWPVGAARVISALTLPP
jgi:predicted nucleic acid-binding protein